jgi:hypothetical protein
MFVYSYPPGLFHRDYYSSDGRSDTWRRVDNNDVALDKKYTFLLNKRSGFFSADHLAGASVSVKSITGDGKKSSSLWEREK